ncbi:hypothetical protein G5714_010709 [Onychostoma macrolepis]|uniref:Uncharacterized protein n=1 Tax=Onychostoma macrolepis TaxID=369639 RepID=A0A7J6CL43_9TELE|nr:hypothetical protein G5714_010709 [Onychostoma macrolepis]
MLPFYLLSLIVTAKAELLPGSCSFQDSICDYMSDPDFLSWTLNPSEDAAFAHTMTGALRELARCPVLVAAIFIAGIGGTFQYGFHISVLNSPSLLG